MDDRSKQIERENMSIVIRMSRQAVGDIEEIADKIYYSEDLLEARVMCSDVIMSEPSSLMEPEARAVLVCFDRAPLFRTADDSSGLLSVLISQEGVEQKVRIIGSTSLARRTRRIFELLEFEEYYEDEEGENTNE